MSHFAFFKKKHPVLGSSSSTFHREVMQLKKIKIKKIKGLQNYKTYAIYNKLFIKLNVVRILMLNSSPAGQDLANTIA